MKRERGGREPRAAQPQAREQPPEQERRAGVQQHVDEVVSERVEAPEAFLDPERREHHGVELLVRPGLRPDEAEAVEAVQRAVRGEIGVVVPDEARGERRQKGRHDRPEE